MAQQNGVSTRTTYTGTYSCPQMPTGHHEDGASISGLTFHPSLSLDKTWQPPLTWGQAYPTLSRAESGHLELSKSA